MGPNAVKFVSFRVGASRDTTVPFVEAEGYVRSQHGGNFTQLTHDPLRRDENSMTARSSTGGAPG